MAFRSRSWSQVWPQFWSQFWPQVWPQVWSRIWPPAWSSAWTVALAAGLACGAPTPQPVPVDRDNEVASAQSRQGSRKRVPKFDVPRPSLGTPPQAKLGTAAAEPPPRVQLPLTGTIFAHGGGSISAAMTRRFVKTCGPDPRIVLIPTASEAADKADYRDKLAARWAKRASVATVLHTLDPAEADTAAFVDPLRTANCVWIGGGAQGRLRDAYVGTRVQDELHALLLRGGTVAGYSAGTAILSGVIIRKGNPEPTEDIGLDLLPEVILDQHFIAHEREPRLLEMIRRHPDRVGYGIDENTALIVTATGYEVVGESVVRRCVGGECTSLGHGDRGRFP